VSQEGDAPKFSRRWRRGLVVCAIGLVSFWGMWQFISNTLLVDARHEYFVTFHVFQEVQHPAHFKVEFCGIELARDDNPDGRDIKNTIDLLNWIDSWGTRFVSLVFGVLVGYSVNIFLRLTFQPRRSDVG